MDVHWRERKILGDTLNMRLKYTILSVMLRVSVFCSDPDLCFSLTGSSGGPAIPGGPAVPGGPAFQ
jgi:hypothetical protein